MFVFLPPKYVLGPVRGNICSFVRWRQAAFRGAAAS